MDPNIIFVFGSNTRGRHGAGAALTAARNWRAVEGVGEGRAGKSYAIPTKEADIRTPRSLDDIKTSVEYFMIYARLYPELIFHVTRIGCGRAGYTDKDIAPMFEQSPHNCMFDYAWKDHLPTHLTWCRLNSRKQLVIYK